MSRCRHRVHPQPGVIRRLVAAAAGLAAVAAAGCGGSRPYEKPLTPVMVADVGRQPLEHPVRYSAAIEPAVRLDLAFTVGGYVTSLASIGGRVLQEGDRVTAGMTLASVRPGGYDARVTQAEAQLAEATAAREAAADAFARAEALFAARSLTRPELDQARSTLQAIDARIAGAGGLVGEARLARADTVLRSPMAGIVVKRLIEIGTLVGPGVPAFVLAETRTVTVVIGVPDTMLSRVPAGAPAHVRTEALPDRRFSGQVTRVSPTADPRSRLFEVEITLGNADAALKPGMVATVNLGGEDAGNGAEREAMVLPLSAVIRPPDGSDGYAVYVVEERDGVSTARLRRVRLGEILGNDVTVVEGLVGGERLIVQGAGIVVDGERVNPTR